MSSSSATDHYDDAYFAWQSKIGEFGAEADRFKFVPFIGPQDRVIDFGCGGGYMLAALTAGKKIGIEVNPHARQSCSSLGIQAVDGIDKVEDAWADVAISHHALEHVEEPLLALRALRRKIRRGGKAVFVVPCESFSTAFRADNVDNHLYTWSPMNLGNLFRAAGFEVVTVERVVHRWVPKAQASQKILGWRLFHALSVVIALVLTNRAQIRIVASNPG